MGGFEGFYVGGVAEGGDGCPGVRGGEGPGVLGYVGGVVGYLRGGLLEGLG